MGVVEVAVTAQRATFAVPVAVMAPVAGNVPAVSTVGASQRPGFVLQDEQLSRSEARSVDVVCILFVSGAVVW